MSKSSEVLTALGEHSTPSQFCQAGTRIDQVIEPERVLGMCWRTNDDVFTYSLKYTKATQDILTGNRIPTKRELLRLLISIFDPLGIIAFYTVQMKILMQKVSTDWDETIPEELTNEWMRWLQILQSVETVEIPR